MVERRAAAAGPDGLFAGHSMRSALPPSRTPRAPLSSPSCATPLAVGTVMRGYVAEGAIWTDDAAARLGL
jgi:hypothetical protein